MQEITIITAFFDIGREKFKSISRSVTTYIEWFERWGCIKNNLVVFCGNDTIKEAVMKIRKNYNLENKTNVEIIDNIYDIERNIYEKMVNISKNPYFLNFRMIKNATSNIPEYDYINFLKSYFMYKAYITCNVNTDFVAWMDFGFDHGGQLYPFKEDWNFDWKCDCPAQIHLFYLPPKIDERPVFEIVRMLKPDSITGGVILCPTVLVEKFWLLNKESMNILLDVGLLDDDQTMLLLSSRRQPELFKLNLSFWFLPVKEFGGEHMRINESFIRPFYSSGKNQKFTSKLKYLLKKIVNLIRFR